MQLTAAEVLGLHRRGTQPGPAPHTRYDISLAKGRLPAEEGSDMPSLILSGQHEGVPADVSLPPPPTTLSHPPHFLSHDQLTYDPLHISASSIPQLLQSSPPDLLVTPAIFQTTSPVPGGDPGKLGTFEGEENEALVQRLAQEWSSGSEDKGGPSPALALTICCSPLPLSKNDTAAVERLAEEWTSGSESEIGRAPHNTIPHFGLAIPKDDQASVRQLAEKWTSGSEAGNAAPASAAGNPTRPASPAT